MEGQTENSYLVERMPSLVIEKILSNILNLTNVSRTCKHLYKYVCQMDKRRSVACIRRFATTGNSTRLTIDDDGVYDSIMNSLRTITNIRVDLDIHPFTSEEIYRWTPIELNERQLERLTAIMQHFGTNITSLMFRGLTVSTDKLIELLNQTPKLESLKFVGGKVFGTATTPLNLSSLKKLSIRNYPGLLEIVNVLPAGSLILFSTLFHVKEDHQSGIIQNILSKQHQVTSLQIGGKTDPAVLCVNHLKLEKLELGKYDCHEFDQFQLVDILKCHTNLKELRLSHPIRMWAFKWICDNLNELEVLHADVNFNRENTPSMLAKLKKLRHFSTNAMNFLPDDKFQCIMDSLAKLTIPYKSWRSEPFNQMVQSMVRTFTNLTALEINLRDFSELSFVLAECTTLIHLTSYVTFPTPQQLAQKYFPNIRHLTIDIYNPEESRDNSRGMSVIISIVRAMPKLKSLWVPSTKIPFNINAVKEFIETSKKLEELKVDCFQLDHDLSPIDGFVDTIRRLSDQLKAYRFIFRSYGQLDLNPIVGVLSNEFNVPGYKDDSCYFDLCKGVLSKFRAW